MPWPAITGKGLHLKGMNHFECQIRLIPLTYACSSHTYYMHLNSLYFPLLSSHISTSLRTACANSEVQRRILDASGPCNVRCHIGRGIYYGANGRQSENEGERKALRLAACFCQRRLRSRTLRISDVVSDGTDAFGCTCVRAAIALHGAFAPRRGLPRECETRFCIALVIA